MSTPTSTALRTLRNQPPHPRCPSIWRRLALPPHNPHDAILGQFNVIRVLVPGELINIAMGLGEPSYIREDVEGGGIAST